MTGRRNPRRKIHSREQRICCSRNSRPSRPSLDHLPLPLQLRRKPRCSRASLRSRTKSSGHHRYLVCLLPRPMCKPKNTNTPSSDITQDGKFIYLTLTTANHIAALDISDLNNVKRLDNPDEVQPTIGPHYIKVTPDQKHIVVTDYFVQTGEIGLINTPADFKALYIDINPDGSLNFNRTIDFESNFAQSRGGAKPHSVVVFDLTDSANPIYY